MTIFSKIVKGEIPCYKIAETDQFLAFLDAFPVLKGHTLIVPKQEIDYIYDLPDDLLAEMHLFAKKIAKAVKAYTKCERISVLVAGFEVPHAHIHLLPTNEMRDIQFAQKLKFSSEEFKEIAEGIQKELAI
jgi:histidine triad (HIT) family protein